MKKVLFRLAMAFLILTICYNTYAEEAKVCLNCGSKAVDNYCSMCGYANSESLPVLGDNEAFLSLKFTYESNAILAKYDVDVQLDGSYVGTIKQKETLEKVVVVKKGIHEITLHKGEGISAAALIDVWDKTQFSCKIKAHISSLEMKNVINSSPASDKAALEYSIRKNYGQCKEVDYEWLCRLPAKYKEQPIHINGVVISVSENFSGEMKVIVKDTKGNLWFVNYDRRDDEPRLLLDDSVDIYGRCKGIKTYFLSDKPALPTVELEYLKLN